MKIEMSKFEQVCSICNAFSWYVVNHEALTHEALTHEALTHEIDAPINIFFYASWITQL